MADKDFKQRYWGRLQQLQKEHQEAKKSGDFALAKKRKEDIRRVASVPFDSYIRRVNGEQPENQEMPEDMGEGEADQDQQFGQPVNQRQQQEQRTAGQEQADIAQQKALGEQPKVSQAKEAPPGGPAIEATKKQAPQQGAQPTGEQPRSRAGQVADKGKEVAKQALDQAMKYVKKAVAQLAKKAVVAFFSSPYGWAIIGIILGIILLILIIVLLWSVVFGGHSKVSETGSTITQATNPLSDKEWIQRLLLFSKDDSATKTLSDTMLKGLETELGEIKKLSQYSDKVAQIDAVLQEITAYRASRTETDGKKLITDIKNLVASLLSVPVMPTTIITSCTSEFCKDSAFGSSIHFGSPLNKCNADVKNGKNCPKPSGGSARTFIQFVQNTCDAVDLSQAKNTDVNALFDGKVVRNDPKAGLWVQSGLYTANYAHLSSGLKEGAEVKIGTSIGKTALDHVHFELSYGNNPASGQCVVVTQSEYATGKTAGNAEQSILWNKMKTVMRLP